MQSSKLLYDWHIAYSLMYCVNCQAGSAFMNDGYSLFLPSKNDVSKLLIVKEDLGIEDMLNLCHYTWSYLPYYMLDNWTWTVCLWHFTCDIWCVYADFSGGWCFSLFAWSFCHFILNWSGVKYQLFIASNLVSCAIVHIAYFIFLGS